MEPVGYVLRDSVGGLVQGAIKGSGGVVPVPAASQVSLNLSEVDVAAYSREGSDLVVSLVDGRDLRLEGFFEGGAVESRLYLSDDGTLTEVSLAGADGGSMTPSYDTSGTWGKWSPDDALIFAPAYDVAEAGRGFGAGLLGLVPGALGATMAGTAAVGATALGVAALSAGGDDSGSDGPVRPSVDQTPIAVGGDDASTHVFDIVGRAEPGSSVEVRVGDEVQQVAPTEDGDWAATFVGDTLPADGTYGAIVVITYDDDVEELTGPDVIVDTTPPDLAVTDGTADTGDYFNAATLPGGVILAGIGEPGAALTVTLAGETATTTIDEAGAWRVTFEGMSEGEYIEPATFVAVDAMGNSTTLTGDVVIDTIPAPIAFATVEGDDVVNGAEAADDVIVSGTSEPGAAIALTWGGATRTVTVSEDGNWSATFTQADAEAMVGDSQIVAEVTDVHGNVSSGMHAVAVDLDTFVSYDAGPFAGDGTVNEAEAAQGVVVTGTAEPGAALVISSNGVEIPATADGAGAWSALIPAAALGTGASATLSVTATDAAGNTATDTHVLALDIGTAVTIDTATAGGDGTVNAAEQETGLTLTGTAEPGVDVAVEMNGAVRYVTATSAGTWAAEFAASEVPTGTQAMSATATATDAAGNSATASGTFAIDTETSVTVDTEAAGGDGTVNATEAAVGLDLVGTAEAGALVEVALNGTSRSTTADANGNWAAFFTAAELPTGTLEAPVTVQATDAAGNTATASGTVRIDTEVEPLTANAGDVAGNGIVNAAEALGGFELTGTVEQGATVDVSFEGTTRAATVASDGSWAVAFSADEVPEGSYDAPLRVTATDEAGNTRTVTEEIGVDTNAPDAPFVTSFTKGLTGVRSIGSPTTEDTLDIAQVNSAGDIDTVAYQTSDNPGFGETRFAFSEPIADGSHLVVKREDAAGNETGTLFVLEDAATSNVALENPGYDAFDIAAIDLTFAGDTTLTINEAQLKDLSSGTDTVTISGRQDDTVTANGAVATGQQVEIEGRMHDVYNLGSDGAQLLIDEDVQVIV